DGWTRPSRASDGGGPSGRTGRVRRRRDQKRSSGSVPAGRLIDLYSRYSSRPSGPSSRPRPESLDPPKGEPQSMPNPLTVYVPVRTPRATSSPAATSAVHTEPDSP